MPAEDESDPATLPSWSPPGSGWTIGSRDIGWVMYVPRDGNELARASSRQPATTTEKLPGGAIRATWARVTDDSGEQLDIAVTVTMSQADSGRTFRMSVANNSSRVVASALFPVITGITVPDGRTLSALTRSYFGAEEHQLWPAFQWNKGYYGTVRPMWMTSSLDFGNPTAPFAIMHDGHDAVAASVPDPSAEIVAWSWELDPGYADTVGDRPAADSAVILSAVHLIDLPPAQTRQLPDVRLDHAVGGWQAALRPFRAARERAGEPGSAIHPPPQWACVPHSWYQVQLNSSAGERRVRFDDLPELAQQCKDNGVSVLHVIGWNNGGQDRGNPSHDPDPALGGTRSLTAAIAQCQDVGVRVVLFTKFTWADRSTDRFRSELCQSAVRDPYGDYYVGPAYQYLTPHQLLDVTPRRLIPMCFLDERYLQVCEEEFDKVVATGADGMLFDEAMHHTPALLCYDTSHGHAAGASVYAGDAVLARRLSSRLPSGREFLFAAETIYERLQPSYHLSYIRSHYADHVPLHRYVSPGLRMLTTVSGFDDRNQINQALTYGYLLCYEPYHFKGLLADMPLTTAYGRRADKLRLDMADVLWDGTYLGDAPMAVPPSPSLPALASATWVSACGATVYLVANYGAAPVSVRIGADVTESRTVETAWQPAGADITIPPRSLGLVR